MHDPATGRPARRARGALAAALLLLLLPGCATKIAGRVQILDEAGRPLPREQAPPEETAVNIINTTAPLAEASSSAPVAPDGRFVKKDLPPGRYKVEVSRPGFVTVTQEGELKKFRTLEVDARLTRIPVGERRSIAEGGAEEDKIVNAGDVHIAPPAF
ncbi:MAG TPA: carboxypeptidase-like regulatory domain-containing protein [Thermodesulfobacteriota bacterium]|nr:carboxypeptidase-like regulatory domain-containing protein [Thermodesulfobacteriota bacterium]